MHQPNSPTFTFTGDAYTKNKLSQTEKKARYIFRTGSSSSVCVAQQGTVSVPIGRYRIGSLSTTGGSLTYLLHGTVTSNNVYSLCPATSAVNSACLLVDDWLAFCIAAKAGDTLQITTTE